MAVLILFFLGINSAVGSTLLSRIETSLNILADKEFYLALANPDVKYVRFSEGMRKEQIASIIHKKLAWSDSDIKDFLSSDASTPLAEGTYFPDSYVIQKDISGADMRQKMFERFQEKVSDEFIDEITSSHISMEKVLTIASIIQREAAGKNDMNLISGIIWNRLFSGMKLDMDATLQYAKGSSKNGWWPKVVPKDKSIASPYNTYKNKGLPPAPIANPGIAAIEAALNPIQTDCLYYFHKNKTIFCSKDYKEHVLNIEEYLK